MDTHETHPKSEVTTNHAVLDRLMMTLGYLLLNWSMLEQAVLDDIKRLRNALNGRGGRTSRQRPILLEARL
jgi:hypothetical protein